VFLNENEIVVAVVQKVDPKGAHGPFALAESISKTLKGESITFFLDESVWLENDHPDDGIYVVLSDLRKKRAGWRAYEARFYRPSDEGSVPIPGTSK
jgi:hypothetical protein